MYRFISRSIIVLFMFSVVGHACAQWQNANWRFGYSGSITFSPNGAAIGIPTQTLTQEGAAAISDRSTGALLFYTDGVTVWNSNNTPMPNGNGLFGGVPGLLSSTTAASIVREPGSQTRYWIFTIDEQASNNGLCYSIVDMTLNGGLGDVLPSFKNIPVFATTSEKLLIVPNSVNSGYWIITHDNQNSFYCFALSASGLNTTPVVSNVSAPQFNGAGHFKMNRTFDRLAMGSFFNGTIGLYPFDNSTGVFSTPVEWTYTFGTSLQYGIEFSPNGRLLYTSNLENLIQYDLSSGDAATIQASAYTVFQGGFLNGSPATLQLAQDRKIYCNLGSSIATIECPNFPGSACNFVQDAFQGNAGGGYGLNPWVYDIDAPEVVLQANLNYTENCADTPIVFQINSPIGINSVSINWGDGNQQTFNDNFSSISKSYLQPGVYSVSVDIEAACELISFDTTITVVNCIPEIPDAPQLVLQGDTCDLTSPLTARVFLNGVYDQVTLDFGDGSSASIATFTNPTSNVSALHTYNAPGEYTVCVRALSNGLLDTTVCRTIVIGLCCKFELNTQGFCTETATLTEVTGTNNISNYAWNITMPEGGILSDTASAPQWILNETGLYRIVVTIDGECGEKELIGEIIKAPCEREFCSPYVPNSFTPDNDGVNEIFEPVFGCDDPQYRLKVFNRWGQQIYDSGETQKGWNGGIDGYYAQDGIYFYTVEYAASGKVMATTKGHLTLIR